jgi:hypothetical protein
LGSCIMCVAFFLVFVNDFVNGYKSYSVRRNNLKS